MMALSTWSATEDTLQCKLQNEGEGAMLIQ